MKLSTKLITAGCLLALAGTSRAAQISSPPVYGAFFQQVAQCTVGNVGPTPVVAAIDIVDETGKVVASNSGCRIDPNFLCQVSAFSLSATGAYACTATTAGSAAKLRGNIAILDSLLPLSASDLH